MERLVKNLRNARKVIFDNGTFDEWCVYVVEPNGSRRAPLDVEYFTDLKELSVYYSAEKVYRDFVSVYELTKSTVDAAALQLIDNISPTYLPVHQSLIEQWMSVLYAGMVAEENKQHAVLKKRIKRLGMHQMLIDNLLPAHAANFSKGKSWRELDVIMKHKGF